MDPVSTASRVSRAPSMFAATCCKCHMHLRIFDDLPPNTDVTQSFRGNIADSFVVVPPSNLDEFIGNDMTTAESDRSAPSKARPDLQGRVPPLEQVSRAEHIIGLASGQSEADHPVCVDCLEQVKREVQRQVDQASDELKIYAEASRKLEEELCSEGVDEAARLEADILEMGEEERRLCVEIERLDREEEEIEAELAQIREEEDLLRKEDEDFWLNVAEYQLDLEESEEERARTSSQIQYATAELNRLKRTNVLNDMFHIAQEGSFGTINKFRMGRLPEQKVPWEEINAAWGQACLLLDALVKKCQIPMTQYRLQPRGSYSAIQDGADTFELHKTDGGLTRFFSDRNYDTAMVSFLGCLKEVTRFLQRDPTMRLPFKIEADKVGGFSIKLQFNQDERWTKALKFMLTDLKWIIAFVESRGHERTQPSSRTSAPATSVGT